MIKSVGQTLVFDPGQALLQNKSRVKIHVMSMKYHGKTNNIFAIFQLWIRNFATLTYRLTTGVFQIPVAVLNTDGCAAVLPCVRKLGMRKICFYFVHS
jgi:hypothetical protein